MPHGHPGTGPRWLAPAAALMAAILAFLFRVVPVRTPVLGESGPVRFLDSDSYFHLRQATSILGHFPHIEREDRFERFPKRVRSDGTGLFDVGLAAATRIIAGSEANRDHLVAVSPWITPLLAALAVLLLYPLSRLSAGPVAAAWTCWAALLWPGAALPVTLLGVVDHHAAEIVLAELTLFATHAAWLCRHRRPAAAVAAALPLAVFLFTWIGAGLHVVTLGIILYLILLVEIRQPEGGGATARCAGLLAASTLALTVTAAAVDPDLVISPESFQVAIVGLAGLLAGPALVIGLARHLRSTAVVIGVTLVPPIITVCLTDRGRDLAHRLLTPKSALVSENAPLTFSRLATEYGPLPFLALLALILMVRCLRDEGGQDRILPIGYATLWVLLWCRTGDYGYLAGPMLALLAGLAVDRLRVTRVTRPLLLGVLLAPPILTDLAQKPWGTPELASALTLTDRAWDDAMDWLRTATPPLEPPYGVAANWDRGNVIACLGERPAAWSRYPDIEAARWLIGTDESQILQILSGHCRPPERIRYVVLHDRAVSGEFLTAALFAGESLEPYRATGGSLSYGGRNLAPASYGDPYREAVSVRLYHDDGSGLNHHRLVHETLARSRHAYRHDGVNLSRVCESLAADSPTDADASDPGHIEELPSGAIEYGVSVQPSIKIFEIVPGAVCEGRALPGTVAVLRLTLEVAGTGRRFTAGWRMPVGADGTFRVTLPYPTVDRPEASDVRTAGPYELEIVGLAGVRLGEGTVAVREEEVQRGATVVPQWVSGQ